MSTSKPLVAPTSPVKPVERRSQYDEQQNDELEVLRSVFPDGFQDLPARSAWSKTDKSFSLRLSAESDPNTFITLSVTFTATYPKSLPVLALQDETNLREKTLEIVRHIVSTRPKELAGEVMILELATDIRDTLEDAVQARIAGAALPSLEEERASKEAAAQRAREQSEELEAKRLLQLKAEEERMMQQMMEGETKRREAAWKKRGVGDDETEAAHLEYDPRAIIFDQEVKVSDSFATEECFRAVTPVRHLGKGSTTEVLEVHSIQPRGAVMHSHPTCLVLKRASLSHSKAKKSILDLEDELEKLKTLRHQAVLNVLDFKITHHNDDWQFDILTDFGGSSSVAELLDTVDMLPAYRARSFAIEALQALDFYHKNGIIHGRIHLNNLILSTSSTGSITIKLADAGFQQKLHFVKADGKKEAKDRAKFVRQSSLFTQWQCPESTGGETSPKSRKTDIWDFGVVFAQMVLGVHVPESYSSAQIFVSSAGLSPPFQDMMRDLFRSDPRKRPNAFDVIPCEFLRTDVGVLGPEAAAPRPPLPASRHRSFQHSISHDEPPIGSSTFSRYFNEWDESGRLGKGGYGEVVKSRNKLDGRIYAIKKITGKTPAQLSEVLSEVYLLATLNHPYVVRYYTAWPENEAQALSETGTNSSTTSGVETGTRSATDDAAFDYGQSTTGGLDFISSSGYPKITFDDEYDDDDSDDDDDDDLNNDSIATAPDDDDDDIFERNSSENKKGSNYEIPRTPKARVPVRATLYIQMEFCERRTLRDTIRNGLWDEFDEIWRFMRQILEGLAHIHGHGIIHRDLKPENIFIDTTNNPKIGDFGLATSGQYQTVNADDSSRMISTGDMTRSIGTAMYVAPELRSSVAGNYTEKVDMYSLGIIFFEMCFPLRTAMERGHVLGALRLKEHTLPQEFQLPERQTQGEIIQSLIRHKPSERPSSAELLRGGKMPIKIEDEQVRHALSSLSDPTSPYYHRMMSTLFSQGANRQLLDRMWDAGIDAAASADAIDYTLLQGTVKERIVSVFRRYGAVETSRQGLIPRSDHYPRSDVFQLLDPSGTLVQLPYDLILPHARVLAKNDHAIERSFTFGTVFRESPGGGAPRSNKEADFDIVTYDTKDGDLALTEAEVIKCVDDMINDFPCFSKTPMCFHVSHSGLLDVILEFCRVPQPQIAVTKQIIGKLNIGHWTWQKIRTELRSPEVSIPSTSIDELTQFDFRDTPEKAFTRLQALFANSGYLARVQTILVHVSGLYEYTKRFGVRRKVWFSPLSSFNSQFYRDAIMFQCLFDTKKKDVLAAGGRYDSLIEDHRSRAAGTGSHFRRSIHAMGTNIAWDRLVSAMARYQKSTAAAGFLKREEAPETHGGWITRRCDALVASFDASVLRSVGVKLVAQLRAHEISAELAVDTRAPEQLLAHYKDDRHSWVIMIKHDPSVNEKPELKVRSMDKRGESSDMRSAELISYLRAEIRERDAREGTHDRSKWQRHYSASANAADEDSARGTKGDVRVLLAKSKGPKKTYKTRMVEAAHVRVKELLGGYADGPIASIETRDEVLERIRETRLSDPESWRRVVQDVPIGERQYVTEVHDLISGFKAQYAERWRKCFVYNFRTGTCVDYDLWL